MNANFSVSTSFSLLERSIAGETDAWGRLNDIYAPMIYTWVRMCGIQPNDASEITQKTFIRVFKQLGSFEHGPGRFRGWLWTISRNLVRDFVKTHARRQSTIESIDVSKIETKPWNAIESSVPPTEIARRAMAHLLHDFDERSRVIIQEVIMEERDPKDVAEQLGISANAVYIAKSRALKKLRELLADVEYPGEAWDAGENQ